ncbi:MAG: hypothetical protein GZ088_09485 [Acidipila sp.]|nr:hypothetical protein [Acidipila sp.]
MERYFTGPHYTIDVHERTSVGNCNTLVTLPWTPRGRVDAAILVIKLNAFDAMTKWPTTVMADALNEIAKLEDEHLKQYPRG